MMEKIRHNTEVVMNPLVLIIWCQFMANLVSSVPSLTSLSSNILLKQIP